MADVIAKSLVVLLLGAIVVGGIVAALLFFVRGSPQTRKSRRDDAWKYLRGYGNWYLVAAVWAIGWVWIWAGHASKETAKWVYEPAVVALSLGLIAILVFAYIFDKQTDDKVRASIAITFVLVFLLLVIDLLTIKEFREALSDVSDVKVTVTREDGGLAISAVESDTPCESTPTPTGPTGAPETGAPDETTTCIPVANEAKTSFVEGLFGTFKWALTAIIAFYFLTGAIENGSKEKTKREMAKEGRNPDGTPLGQSSSKEKPPDEE